MDPTRPNRLERLFRSVIAARGWVLVVWVLLLPPAVYFAVGVEQDDSLDRLIVQSDPDYVTAKEFEAVFGGGEFVMLLAEAPDPFAPGALRRVLEIERRLGAIERVGANSALSVYGRAHPSFDAAPEDAAAFRRFATGTDLFRRQGLVGDGFLGIALGLDVRGPAERREVLARIDAALADVEAAPAPLSGLRKVGGPYVSAQLESETGTAVKRYFPVFALFIVTLNLALYRSFRALAAFMLTIGASAALTMGYVGATGGVLTIVSSLVPMTVLITCTATLVYVHSRFVEHPAEVSFEDHQIFALANKFLPCTASIFATAVGFAALTVSNIRPIRELGIWVAVGLLITWVAVFTLFPALQRTLRTPTRQERRVAAPWFAALVAKIPAFTYRWRWGLVSGAFLLCVAGAIAVFGLPGLVSGMPLETDALEYIDPSTAVYRDTKRLEEAIAGLSVTEVWLRGPVASVTEPAFLAGVERFARDLEADPRIGAAIGPTTALRMMLYVGGEGDVLPRDPARLEKLAGDFEQLLPTEPALARFVDAETLSQARVSVITRARAFEDFRDLGRLLAERWSAVASSDPALAAFEMRATGQGPLEAKIAYHMVPTLVESFAITAVIIFVTFLLIFRSGAARLMAMIPSLFAILAMFAFMRATGIGLNVATILIASTALGASENDQIHFFHHYLERRRTGSTEEGLRHALLVSGRAILFATLINAGGFLAFALSDLPPMRQFGILAALAFTLSMLADFTALPAALWILSRQKPDRPTTGAP